MIFENIVTQYAPKNADEILKKEKAEDQKYISLIETLRTLKEFDPQAYQELEEAMKFIRGEGRIYSLNLLAEYGLLDNEVVKAVLESQQRVLAIVKSNKDITSISEAMNLIGGI